MNSSKKKFQKPLKNLIKQFIITDESELTTELYNYFSGKKIYIEIYNDNLNISESFVDKIKIYNPIIYKTLSKNLEYIVFKDGRLKTKKFASLNNIKLVNPIWIDDKISKGIFDDDSNYTVKVNYVEFVLDKHLNNKKEQKKCLTKDTKMKSGNDDEFDIKLDNYIDAKMKTNKSEDIYHKQYKDQLYYPLLDKTMRRKRISENKYININHENNNSPINLENKLNSNSSKNSKISKNKSANNLKNQTILELKDGQLTFAKYKDNNSKTSTKSSSIKIDIFDIDNKINIYTYNCNMDQIQSLANFNFFTYKSQITDIEKEFDTNKDLLIIDFDKNKYNYKIYQFLFKKIFMFDIYNFLLEFTNESFTDKLMENKIKIVDKLNSIQLCNDFSLLKIKSNINDIPFNNDNKNYYTLNKNLKKDEYNVLQTMLRKYLNAKDISDYKNDERNKNKSCKNLKLDNIILDEETSESTQSSLKFNNYLITNNKETILNIFQLNENVTSTINSSFVYDSFKAGHLIDLSINENLKKYKM